MEDMKERMKRVEKSVYERIEKDYLKLLTDKDAALEQAQYRIEELEAGYDDNMQRFIEEKCKVEMANEAQRNRER